MELRIVRIASMRLNDIFAIVFAIIAEMLFVFLLRM